MVSRLLPALLLATCSVQAADLEGVKLADRIEVDGQPLELNGMALRTRFFFKVYVAGLYLPHKLGTTQQVLEARGAKRIVLVMMREADAEQFCESVALGLRRNHNDAELQRVRAQTDELMARIRAIGEARKGTTIVLDYLPSAGGTLLEVDGVRRGAPIAGDDFYDALLRIWLGEQPAQDDLKRALLGQEEEPPKIVRE
jgi:Chalcone isomerase-like